MSILYGNNGRRSNSILYGDDGQTGAIERTIENYKTRLGSANLTPPPPEDKRGFLLKALDIIDRPRNAVVNAIYNTTTGRNDFLPSLAAGFTGKQHANTSDLLKEAGVTNKAALAIGGFLGDVALDPTTYLTLGGGAAIKSAAKAGAGAVAKTGLPALIGATRAGQKAEEAGQALGKTLIPRFGLPEEYANLRQEYIHGLNYARDKKLGYIADIAKKNNLTPDEAKLVMGGLENPISLQGADRRLVDATRELKGMFERGIKEEQAVLGNKVKARQNYAPHVRLDTGELVPGGATISPLRPSDKFTRGRKIEGTVQEINQQFGKEFFDPNAINAAAVREYSRLGGVQTKRFIDDTLVQFGRKVKPGYKAGANEGIYTVQNFKLYPVEDVYGGIHQAFTKNVPTFALPKEIADDLNKFYTTFVNDQGTKEFLRLYDKVQNVWKGLVTAPNPSFHIRNALGNLWNSYLAGMNNPARYAQAARIQRGLEGGLELAGKNYTNKEILDLASKEGILGFGQFGADLASSVRDLMAQKTGQITLNPLKLGRRVGNAVEDNAKIGLFIDQLGKGKNIKEAAQTVKKYLFDYGDLTTAEKNVFRRVVPFYTFWRKNLPLQLEHLFTQPGKYTGLEHLAQNTASASGVKPEEMPDWMREQGALALGDTGKKGVKRVLTLGLPMSDVNSLSLRDTLARVSPMLRTPFELATNQQIYNGIPIESYQGQEKKVLGANVPAKTAYLLSQIGLTRMPSEYLGSLLEPENRTKQLPVISRFLRELNLDKTKTSTAFDRRQQLADFVKAAKAQGIELPTMNELKKASKKSGFSLY